MDNKINNFDLKPLELDELMNIEGGIWGAIGALAGVGALVIGAAYYTGYLTGKITCDC